MGAVDDDPQAVQRACGSVVEQVLDVARPPAPASGRDPADAAARWGAAHGSRSRASMASSTSSASLWPPRAKNLMPLSGTGLCEADSIDAEVGAGRGDEVGDRRGRQHPDVDDVDARRWPARRRRRRRGTPRTRAGRGRPRRAAGARRTRRASPSTCAAATERSSASSAVTSSVRETAHAVGAEEPSHVVLLARTGAAVSCHADAPREPTTGRPRERRGARAGVARPADQRLLYCGALRAFFSPAFLRSLTRGSRRQEAGLLQRRRGWPPRRCR